MEEPAQKQKSSMLARGSKGGGRWLLHHPVGAVQLLLALLAVVIVFQNLEPTSIDILFWTLVDIPKLFLLLISMVIGALIWEMLRRRFIRAR
ncbi:hypothetical protein A11A3_05991 [Alcanivorax hongdengensis A-11-3]|uniref:Lipopolysaccharide assembly protein A domain-containing protein n=1 Tax=Alcanivorax hongdengensis A-11-3 TaxID=1177179 RepID=L0WDC0_9GAMM|nr:hypothetical protein [Alcanivorax hongdengensis]EKF74981.1 hypothetical protein A11A3_05991 [Alcanivorax hongdengensis A-11-3]